MNQSELWSDEYFIDKINRTIKNEIAMLYHVRYDRKENKQEYEEWFEIFVKSLKCEVTDYDLGIFND